MTSSYNFLLFISLVSSAILQCHAQLNGLPQSTLHAISSEAQSVSQPTAVPSPPGTDTDTGMEPGGEPVSAPELADDTLAGQSPQDSPQAELTTLFEDTAAPAGGHLTAGIGASQNGSQDNGHLVSSAGGGISIGAVVAIIVAVVIVITACATLLLVRRRRQQRTHRAAAGMRQLKLGGSHVKVQTSAISKPMPVQLGVGYSQHYKAQGYEVSICE